MNFLKRNKDNIIVFSIFVFLASTIGRAIVYEKGLWFTLICFFGLFVLSIILDK